RSSSRMNANAALIAGVATLVLAIGVGFLIGRAGHENSTQAQAPQVIKVEGGGGGEATEGVGTEESTAGGATESSKGQGGSGGSATPGSSSGKATKKAQENAKEGAHGGTEGVEKVLHTASGVKLPEAEQEIGGSCEQGTAGCGNSGKFEGTFFE
ncbi:MAG TPA: hypothetical protein VHU86_00515, partial [Solirubrobacterales bacterium]|nr:hypothetical protein [Solirubrobacterales bacterium]